MSDFDHPPRPLTQRLGAILWPSFFAAGVASMVFFAAVDPAELKQITALPYWPENRQAGYTLGFLLFWAATSASSAFTWLLLRPASRFNRTPR